MEEDTKNKVNKLLSSLDGKEFEQEIQDVIVKDPIDDLKMALFSFFKNRLNKIDEQESFKKVVQNSLEEKILNDELSISQLMSLFKVIYSENTIAIDSLLSLFKPSQAGAVTPLLDKPQLQTEDERSIKQAFDNYTSEELQKINQLMVLLKNLPEDKEEKDN